MSSNLNWILVSKLVKRFKSLWEKINKKNLNNRRDQQICQTSNSLHHLISLILDNLHNQQTLNHNNQHKILGDLLDQFLGDLKTQLNSMCLIKTHNLHFNSRINFQHFNNLLHNNNLNNQEYNLHNKRAKQMK